MNKVSSWFQNFFAHDQNGVSSDQTFVVQEGSEIEYDGFVVEGCGILNEAAVAGVSSDFVITDETPIDSDRRYVYAGTMLITGSLKIRKETRV